MRKSLSLADFDTLSLADCGDEQITREIREIIVEIKKITPEIDQYPIYAVEHLHQLASRLQRLAPQATTSH